MSWSYGLSCPAAFCFADRVTLRFADRVTLRFADRVTLCFADRMTLWIQVCGVRPVPVEQEQLIAGDEFGDHQSLILGGGPEVGHRGVCPAELPPYHDLRNDLQVAHQVI